MKTISDEMLRNTRALLVARSNLLRERIQRAHAGVDHVDLPVRRDAPGAEMVLEDDEVLQAVEESARGELDQIERALERIEAGSFTTCEACGAAIDAKRISVVPYAVRCAQCAQDA